jgi:hypothetical protein
VSASLVLAQGPTTPRSFKITVNNPTPFNSIEEIILAVLAAVRVIAIPIIIFFIIYSGFLYVTARGNAQQIEQATRQLTYAILGAILILGAIVLAEIIKQLINDFR